MRLLRPLAFLLSLLLASTVTLAADLPQQLKKDFQPLSGIVLQGSGDEILIDLGREQGVHNGDLFSVVAPGPPIVNPQTGEELGRPLRVKGLLQATWVQPRYSQVHPLGQTTEVPQGSAVRRYFGLSATFSDETGKGELLYLKLRDALPQLHWLGYRQGPTAGTTVKTTETAQLFFILNAGGWDVRGPGQQLLRHYPPAGATAANIPSPIAGTPPVVPQQPTKPAPSTVAFKDLGKLPGRIVASDFVREGDRLLLAATTGNGWEVLSVEGQPKVVAHSDPNQPGKILSLHWWLPKVSGPLYLAITRKLDENAAGSPTLGSRIASNLLRLEGDRLVAVRAELAALVGSFDLDGDGRPETLLGQNFDRDITFGGWINSYRPSGDGIVSESTQLKLPQGFPVIGSVLFRPKGDELLSAWVNHRTLFIARGDRVRTPGKDDAGGSLSTLTYDLNPDAADRVFRTVPLEVSPLVVDLAGDDRWQLVTIASSGGLLHLANIEPEVDQSWLLATAVQNGSYHSQRLAKKLDGAIQGLAWDHGRLLLVNTPPGDESSRLLALRPSGAAH